MIVKNEAPVILRCLESTRCLVDYVLVMDTGSSDGTQTIIRDYLAANGIPGEVVDRPWREHAHNRTEGIEALRRIEGIDYGLTLDADEYFIFDEHFDAAAFKAALRADAYSIEMDHGDTWYVRWALFSNRLPFRYDGLVHDYIVIPEGASRELARGIRTFYTYDGARSRTNPNKAFDDAKRLEAELLVETDPRKRSRHTFFLAQSYRDGGDDEKAMANYLKRADMGLPIGEVYMSFCYAAAAMHRLGLPLDLVITTYLRAYECVPMRAEALYGAAQVCRLAGHHQHGYLLAKAGTDIPRSDALYISKSVYAYKMLDEFQMLAYWSGHYDESVEAAERLLAEAKFPESERARIETNAALALAKYDEMS